MMSVWLLLVTVLQLNTRINFAFSGTYQISASPSISSTFFPFNNSERFDIRACENSQNLTYFGLYARNDDNLQGLGYEQSSGQGVIYRLDILPLADATFNFSIYASSASASSLVMDISGANDSYVVTLRSEESVADYECLLPYEASAEPYTIIGTSMTGPNDGDDDPPENMVVTDSQNGCFFYEPDSDDPSSWHPGESGNGTVISDSIYIGGYSSHVYNDTYGIIVIARYGLDALLMGFCRVSPLHTFGHVQNHTSFCKTFVGMSFDATYRTCPLCSLPVTVESDCQQNEEEEDNEDSATTIISSKSIAFFALLVFGFWFIGFKY